MSEEEIIKYAKIFYTAHGDTFKIHFDDRTINEPDVWKGVLDYIEKIQKENKESKELYNKLLIGYNKLVQEYLELEKENKELKEDNSHQWEERCRLTFELKKLQKENIELKKDISNMYNKEVVISIICDNFDVTRLEVLEMLGEEE